MRGKYLKILKILTTYEIILKPRKHLELPNNEMQSAIFKVLP